MPTRSLTNSLTRSPAGGVAGVGVGGFNILSLFSAGEQGGAWVPELRSADAAMLAYESNETSSPPTIAGGRVGMLLDISQSIALGSAVAFGGGISLAPNTGSATDNGDGTYTLSGDARARFNCTLASMVNGAAYQVGIDLIESTGTVQWDWCDQYFSKAMRYPGAYVGVAQRATYDATFRFVDVSALVAGPVFTFRAPVVRRVSGNHMVQATQENRPTFATGPDRIDYGGTGSLTATFPAALGSNCTIIRSIPGVGASISTGNTIGTSYTDTTNHCGLIIVNRPLTGREVIGVTNWANGRAFYSQQTRNNVAAWGDSLTKGDQDFQEGGYPRRLSAILGRGYFNGGVGGETSTQIKARALADTQGRNGWVNLFWLGRNNASDHVTVKADIAACVANLATGNDRYLVLSVLNASTEGIGTGTYDAIITLNQDLANLYGSRFVDVRQYLIAKGDGGATDNADVANGVVPSSLRVDSIHLNAVGYQHVADCVRDAMLAAGY